jgi:hypothetical protein
MKTKVKHLYITPKNIYSRIIFEEDLRKLHSCKILKKESNKTLVQSIAGEHYFWVEDKDDEFWTVTYE